MKRLNFFFTHLTINENKCCILDRLLTVVFEDLLGVISGSPEPKTLYIIKFNVISEIVPIMHANKGSFYIP